tara:strand:+ start:126 stop:407 length:282 start_codon:yes stop_codon:yes gene_type:complete
MKSLAGVMSVSDMSEGAARGCPIDKRFCADVEAEASYHGHDSVFVSIGQYGEQIKNGRFPGAVAPGAMERNRLRVVWRIATADGQEGRKTHGE